MTKHCCAAFEHFFNQAGQSGSSIIFVTLLDKTCFMQQFRAVAYEDEKSLKPSDHSLKIATQHVIHFCPWCGIKLSKQMKSYYKHQRNDLRIGHNP